MKRTVEVELETTATKVKTAIDRFFVKHSELDYWKEEFEYMLENNIDFESDEILGNGERNTDWTWALHLDVNEHIHDNKKDIYICIIERE